MNDQSYSEYHGSLQPARSFHDLLSDLEGIVSKHDGPNVICGNTPSQSTCLSVDRLQETTVYGKLKWQQKKLVVELKPTLGASCKNCEICGRAFSKENDKHYHKVSGIMVTSEHLVGFELAQVKPITSQDPVEDVQITKSNPVKSRREKETSKTKVARRYKCSFDGCCKTYTSNTSLQNHIRTHTGEKPYGCKVCGKCFHNSKILKQHNLVHSGEKPFKCNECEAAFVRADKLKYHSARHHTHEKKHECSICKTKFIRKDYLENHYKSHTGDKPYQCETCGLSFRTALNLTAHRKKIHEGSSNAKYRCATCGKGFHTKTPYTVHVQAHAGQHPYQCDICGKRFGWKYLLFRHRATHRLYRCSQCSKTFTKLRQLNVHVKSHSEVQVFSCSQCELTVKSKRQLDVHLRNHKLKYQCKKCYRFYKSCAQLVRHRDTHTDIFTCNISTCNSSFQVRCDLIKHLKEDHGIIYVPSDLQTKNKRKFSCHICDKSFVRKYLLRQHLSTFHRQNVIVLNSDDQIVEEQVSLQFVTTGSYQQIIIPLATESNATGLDTVFNVLTNNVIL